MYVKVKKKEVPMFCQHKMCRGLLNQGSKTTIFLCKTWSQMNQSQFILPILVFYLLTPARNITRR